MQSLENVLTRRLRGGGGGGVIRELKHLLCFLFSFVVCLLACLLAK